MAMNVEAEIRDPKRRVSELEGSFGFLTEQIKTVHKDLLGFDAKTEQEFRQVNGRLDALDRKIDAKVDGLARALPGIVSDAVREANRERNKKG